jgi:hypothetical protein
MTTDKDFGSIPLAELESVSGGAGTLSWDTFSLYAASQGITPTQELYNKVTRPKPAAIPALQPGVLSGVQAFRGGAPAGVQPAIRPR